MKIKRQCLTCGKEIYITPYRIKTGRGKFCSKKCKYIYQSKYLHGKNSPKWKRVKRICKFCGKEIYVARHRIKIERGKYCSIKCQDLARKNTPNFKIKGAKSPNWKGGITPLSQKIRHSIEYQLWRSNIFKRDNHTCQKCGLHNGCGKTIYLEAHHNEKSFQELYKEFLQEYDQFSPYEDIDTLVRLAMKWQPFWSAEGETLCWDCHNLTKANIIKPHNALI